MGIVSDFVDAINNAICDTLKSGVEASLSTSIEILGSSLNKATVGENSVLSQFLTTSPTEFTGALGNSVANTTTIWSGIETICNNAVVPIAGMILTIVLLNDLIQMVISGNNFRDFDTSIFIRWIIKCICGITLVSNVFYITSGIFNIGTSVAVKATQGLFGTKSYITSINITDDLNIGQLLVLLILSGFLTVSIFIIFAVIIVSLCSRMIEAFMYLGASPIPMATFMNQEWRQIGNNWLRGVLALAFQGLFIIIALSIFITLFVNTVATLSTSGGSVFLQMGILLGFAFALIFTILRSGAISKSIFNAH